MTATWGRRTVWKHEVPVDGGTHEVPGTIVHAAAKHDGALWVWSEVTPGAPEQPGQRVTVVGTDWDLPEGATHVVTAQSGPFVWHLYRVP